LKGRKPLKSSNALNNPPELKPSRWARASREDLEALAEYCDTYTLGEWELLSRLRASCPPLRTEAEVAAERLRNLEAYVADEISGLELCRRDRALAKEPTRG
jgi:hypothetical protein